MKSTVLSLFLAVVGSFVSANDAFENIVPAKSYKPVTEHNPLNTIKFTADPGVMVYEDTVYIYGTNDGIRENMGELPEANDYDKIHTLNLLSSKDLVNWVDHGTLQTGESKGAASWAHNTWAPAATHKKINGKDKFFLYFADSGRGIGVLTSDSPTGPFVDPLGHILISKQSPNCADVTWLFDPAVFVDDDGTGYIYFGGGIPGEYDNHPLYKDAPLFEAPRTLRVAKLGDDMISLASDPIVLDAPWPYEDSGIHKADGIYYYTYCTNWNDKSPFGKARIGLMASESPLGPFEFVDTIFNNPGDFFIYDGNNHHTVVQFHDKWYIFYHAEWLNTQVYGEKLGYRTTHVNELPYVDGKFLNATGTLEGVPQLFNVDAFQTQLASLMAWQGGVSTNGVGHTTITYQKGEWTGVSQVDFADGANAVVLTASSPNGAVIRITADDVEGEVIAYVTVPASTELQTVTADVDVSGVKNVFFLASDEVVVDTWQFVKADVEADISEVEDSVDEAIEVDAEVDVAEDSADEVEDSAVEDDEKEYTGYLFGHFIGEQTGDEEQIYFAISEDGLNFKDMNNGKPVLVSTVGEKGARDPYLYRSPEGKFYAIATDLSIYNRGGWKKNEQGYYDPSTTGSPYLVLWESEDLVNWTEPRLIKVAPENAGMAWAPEIIYDEETEESIIFFASSIMNPETKYKAKPNAIYYVATKDFKEFSQPKIFIDNQKDGSENGKEREIIDATVMKIGEYYYSVSKDGDNAENGGIRILRTKTLLNSESWEKVLDLDELGLDLTAAGVDVLDNSSLEGPELFELNKADRTDPNVPEYGIIADRYMAGTGYVPLKTTNIEDRDNSKNSWSILSDKEYSFDKLKKRHGTILRITKEEVERLKKAYL